MLPGKKYTPEDVLRIGWRRRWLIAIPFVVIAIISTLVVHYLPDEYRSDTLILVVPQQVPETYVKSTVTARIEDRLQAISQQILSRTRLERIIQDFNLYAKERRAGIMEDIVENMRKNIDVQVVKGDAFRVSFTSDNPRTAMQVTERLASLFIDESLRDREVLAEGTNQFLDAQLEDARRQLVEHEKKVEEYRKKYDGELPDQEQSNLQQIQSAEMQLQNVTEALSRDRDQAVILDRQITDLTTDASAAASASSPSAGSGAPTTTAQALQLARAQLQQLQLHLKPEHPDVIHMKRVVADLEKKAQTEALNAPASDAPAASPADRARLQRLNELKLERERVALSIGNREGEQKRLQGVIAAYQSRVAAAPTREAELVGLTRDYDTLQKSYASLLAKSQDSQIAANLERRQIGEQFKILDAARLPEKPVSPNRPLLYSVGALLGLAFGVGFVALLEYRDTSLKTELDVASTLRLPVLAAVPTFVTTTERAMLRRRKILVSAAAAVFTVAAAAAAFWKFRA